MSWFSKLFGRGQRPADSSTREDAHAPVPDVDPATAGYYDDPLMALLPSYVRVGHGFVVLRDAIVDSLELDGVDIGNPDNAHPHFTGSFRGYFNVPPGRHQLVARRGELGSEWAPDVPPNTALVKRIDWSAGGWVDDDAATIAQFAELARSGSMLQAKALRPWPLASLYFDAPPTGLVLDGRPLRGPAAFYGIVNLAPGAHVLRGPNFEERLDLPRECVQLVEFDGGMPELVDPRQGHTLIGMLLRRAAKGAVISAADLPPAGT